MHEPSALKSADRWHGMLHAAPGGWPLPASLPANQQRLTSFATLQGRGAGDAAALHLQIRCVANRVPPPHAAGSQRTLLSCAPCLQRVAIAEQQQRTACKQVIAQVVARADRSGIAQRATER
jgi:hypothetical protein